MRTTKEIQKQIDKEHNLIVKLYSQINAYEENMKCLKNEYVKAKEKEDEEFIDNWFNEHFKIPNQASVKYRLVFIVFDEYANFVKVAIPERDFHGVVPEEKEGTLKYWLKENNMYALFASAFCDRRRNWYNLSFKEQLKNLGWKFDSAGKITKSDW